MTVGRLLADLTVMSHLAFLVLLATGSLVAWRRPSVLSAHVPAVGWSVLSVTVGVDCPLTDLEKHFRRGDGEAVYRGGFIDHYLDGRLYPHRFAPLVAALVGTAVVVGYVGLWRQRRRSLGRSSQPHGPSGGLRATEPVATASRQSADADQREQLLPGR